MTKPTPPAVADIWRLMYPTPEERLAATKKRHQRWLSMLTERDWDRLRALEIPQGRMALVLDDLDAGRIRVGVVRAGDENWCSGERIGTLRDGAYVVLVWED
jgi:hypothetical protein